jgi:UDP-N-acetylglucosamine--N-acetylmuramyl-(pentapeptide) pyrophosphoryl-undecaprenol N-acetylglucosamine transferase
METRAADGRKVIITGGGTGGHVFPGIAVAQELLKHPQVEVLFVGKKNGSEAKWVADAGLTFKGIKASGFPRSLSLRLFTFWFDLGVGLMEAGRLITEFKPSVVFSTGGYVSVPVSLVAALRGVPVALLEPNVAPGLAARFLALFSKRVFVGFEKTTPSFSKGRTQWTGIPVREEIRTADKSESLKSFKLEPRATTVLMLGGSQGAHVLNQYMTDAIERLGQGYHQVQVIMMTGWTDYQTIVDRLEKCPLKVVLRPFFGNIHEAYAAADLVVARSGAMTCAESLSRGLPAVFIPYPHASGHQEMNARILEKAGSAVVITEKQLESEKLIETLDELLANPEKMRTMGEKASGLARPDASAKIVEALFELTEQRRTA